MNKTLALMGFTLITLMGASLSYADELEIPVSVYVDDFKEAMLERGYNLYPCDSKDCSQKQSVGFVENKGQNFVVHTYKPASIELLYAVRDTAFENVRN